MPANDRKMTITEKSKTEGVSTYAVEIIETLRGNPRVMASYDVHGNQLTRMKARLLAQYRVHPTNVTVVTLPAGE